MIDVGRDFERMRDCAGGQLSEEEHRAFEDRLLRDPGLVRDFEVSLRLSEGLRQLRGQRDFLETAATRGFGFRIWLPALAAALIAGIALWLWVQSPGGPVLLASLKSRPAGVASTVTAHFTFVALRGGAAPDLALPPGGMIEFRAAPGMHTAASHYRVTLVHADAGRRAVRVGTLSGLSILPDGYLHYYADASRLPPGAYVLRVESQTAADTAQTYSFNLRAGAGP